MMLLIACAVLATHTALPPEPAATEAAILQLEEQWRVAQLTNDAKAFAALLAPDLTFIGTSGSFRDRAGYIASRAGSWIPRAASYEVSELRVRLFDSVAVVTGRGATTGDGVNAQARFTHVWARRSGTWQLVAVQRTDVAPQEPGK